MVNGAPTNRAGVDRCSKCQKPCHVFGATCKSRSLRRHGPAFRRLVPPDVAIAATTSESLASWSVGGSVARSIACLVAWLIGWRTRLQAAQARWRMVGPLCPPPRNCLTGSKPKTTAQPEPNFTTPRHRASSKKTAPSNRSSLQKCVF